MNKVLHIKNDKAVGYITEIEIDFADNALSAFSNDGKAYREVTPDIINRIHTGDLIITEYHEQPLGNVIYIQGNSKHN